MTAARPAAPRRSWGPGRAGPLVLALLLAAGIAGASDARAVYDALRGARPEGPGLSVTSRTLARDVLRLRLESGTVQFLTPVEGRIVGAVFSGAGTLELSPASETERDHLVLVTGERRLETLRVPFAAAVFLFTDGTAKELAAAASPADASPSRAAEIWEGFSAWQRRDLQKNLQLRLLEDLLADGAPPGVFLAYVSGNRYPPGLAATDPAGLGWLIGYVPGDRTAFRTTGPAGGIWYCAPTRADLEGGRHFEASPSPHALNYSIDTTIFPDTRVEGTTTIQFVPRDEGQRVLWLQLMERLRLQRVELRAAGETGWRPVPFVQEDAREDADAAVLLDTPLPRIGASQLRLSYAGGDVLRDAGDGNFLVEARDSWYPNLGTLHDLSTYELTYRHPRGLEVVSVGRKISEHIDRETAVSVWSSERPIRVAGFNYGRFRTLERADASTGMTLRVYTNLGTPDFVHSLNQRLMRYAASKRMIHPDRANFGGIRADQIGLAGTASLASAGMTPVHVDPEILAHSALADGLATARVGSSLFGPLPVNEVALTQQTQWFFGQSWPGLVYVPYIAALNGSTRREIGLQGAADFIEQVVPHEFAHQWWGHMVGWGGYRDRWLSEGLAEYTASLVIENSGGPKRAGDYWEKARRWILSTPTGSAVSNAAAGPISLGVRLATPRSPWAYDALVYAKASYVLHMLRMMMRDDASPQPDAAFFGALRDFASTFTGAEPSTGDFQSVMERHLTAKAAAVTGTRLDWFFRQWIDGTDIPRLRYKLRIEAASGGAYRLTGSVTQEGVPSDFRTVARLYVEHSSGEPLSVAVLPLVGNVRATIHLPLDAGPRPLRAMLNARHDVLFRD